MIRTAVERLQEEVPALARLKLVFGLEIRARGDVQPYRVELPGPKDALVAELRAQEAALEVEEVETFERVYGKRIIIVGGGAQVGQVAICRLAGPDRGRGDEEVRGDPGRHRFTLVHLRGPGRPLEQ